MAFWSVLQGGSSPSRADQSARGSLNAELGCEYDSNVHRAELVTGEVNPPIVASPAARAVIGGSFSDTIADDQSVAVSAMGAGKLFTTPAARSEDVAVAQTTGAWRLAAGPRTTVGVDALYYEAFQRSPGDPAVAGDRRDFRSLTSTLRLIRWLGPRLELGAGAGYRRFVLKPDLDYDFQAPTGSLDLRFTREAGDRGAEWELGAGGSVERRAFEGSACGPTSTIGVTCVPVPGAGRRRDDLWLGHLELTRTGKILLGAGYALQRNSSSSFAETVTRHFITLRLTAPLPFELYLAARGELLIASPASVGQLNDAGLTYVSIDDQNRSSLRVDLSRALGERLWLLARYTLYVNELGVEESVARFRRQTALLSLGVTLDRP
jgi:hypothetical protein